MCAIILCSRLWNYYKLINALIYIPLCLNLYTFNIIKTLYVARIPKPNAKRYGKYLIPGMSGRFAIRICKKDKFLSEYGG